MDQHTIRKDDFEQRRKDIRHLTDEQLKKRFWELSRNAVEPLIQLAKTHTTPAIERSVLLRMGFSSLEASVIVEKTIDASLMGKGAGHVVFRYAKIKSIPIKEAGLALIEGNGWDEVLKSFGRNTGC